MGNRELMYFDDLNNINTVQGNNRLVCFDSNGNVNTTNDITNYIS